MILAICRPAPGADADAFAALLAQEGAALRALAAAGVLTSAWTTGRPGAILVLDADAPTAERELQELPLARAGLMDAELQEIHPIPL